MSRDVPIIALFDDRTQALRLCEELRADGIPERSISLVTAAARTDVVDGLVDGGIEPSDAALFADEVCGGATLLAVRAANTERARVAEIIGRHVPIRARRPGAETDAIPGDASADRAPDLTPMPTGSGSLESRRNPPEDDER